MSCDEAFFDICYFFSPFFEIWDFLELLPVDRCLNIKFID